MKEFSNVDLAAAARPDLGRPEEAELNQLPSDIWKGTPADLPSDTWETKLVELPSDVWKMEPVKHSDDVAEIKPADLPVSPWRVKHSERTIDGIDAPDCEQDHPYNDVPRPADIVEYYSTYKERLDQTPTERFGTWQGERGESKFIPNDEEMQKLLEIFGIDGIVYEDGIPDFSPCAAETVEIDHMGVHRENKGGEVGNFQQCDEKCAEKWNAEAKDGKTDWTAADVKNWRASHNYTWHEQNDTKTCDLIPTSVNAYFGHLGGVGECKKRDQTDSMEDSEFDD